MLYEEIGKAIDRFAGVIQYWAAYYKVEVSPSIHFTGGEPFLRDDLFDLLRHARRRGFEVSVLSNGTLITSDIARQARKAEVKDIQVSLDGMEAVHDSIRGKGAFRKALAGIRNLVTEGIDTNISMTVSTLNYAEVDPLVQFAGESGISTVGFSRLVPCGRGKGLNEYLLTPEQLFGLSQKLAKSGDGNRVAIVSRDPLMNMANIIEGTAVPQTEFPIGGCAAGVFGVTITSDGTIMPCRRMDLPVGNIRTDDFRHLWAESPVFASLRDRQCYNSNCRTCRYWAICRGCRAIALANARSRGREDYLSPDPQCAHYRPAEDSVNRQSQNRQGHA